MTERRYEIEIEHRDSDQVFSYYHNGAMLHFNVTLLARIHKVAAAEFRRITMDLDEETYGLCVKHRGIEEAKVAALEPKSLREPGYGIMFDDGLFTIVDGHHRLVRRWRGNVGVMDFWVTHSDIWRHCLVTYSAEEEALLVDHIPPKSEDPALIASRVTLHGRKDDGDE